MEKIKEDKEREERLYNDIIVDAYDDEERLMGWEAYLDDALHFPFEAKCIKEIITSPLLKNEKVRVLERVDTEISGHTMSVMIEWQNRVLGVPLEQLLPIHSDEETLEAVKDWHYWIGRGYQL
ncbi:MAG: calcium-binding protein [Treponema sp.]|jgi:hypothetical protein|nr:calcium-binding protein [Treponema sp.]